MCDFEFDIDDQDVPVFSHEPIRPSRKGVLGETVFSSLWKVLMESADDRSASLFDILCHLPGQITQRHATVAASFINWLGTNCGRGFLSTAQCAASERPHYPEEAWLGAWAIENRRHYGINRGVRTIEHVLAPADHFAVMPSEGICLRKIPDLSPADYETIEQVVSWLSRYSGAQFIAQCTAMVEAQSRRERNEWLIANGVPNKFFDAIGVRH